MRNHFRDALSDLEIWKAKSNEKIDFMISPDFQTEVKLRLMQENITFAVAIDNLQDAIDNENPASTENEPELRSGNQAQFKFFLLEILFVPIFRGE